MATREVITLNETTPELRAPITGDTYSMPRALSIAAETATTDVAAFSLTRTNNNAAVATGVKWTFTDTSSAAGFLPFQILGGAGGATDLFSITKTGQIRSSAYTNTRIPFAGTAGLFSDSANLTFNGTALTINNSTATGLEVGDGGTSTPSIILGDSDTGFSRIGGQVSIIQGGAEHMRAGFSALNFMVEGVFSSTVRHATAGQGLLIAAGTATTDVPALSVTQTWNNAACATGVKWTFTDTSSAAGALPFQILGGASGTTGLFSVTKGGGFAFGGLVGAATSEHNITKAVTDFTDAVAKTVFTLTIPNAAHSASYLVRLTGSIGAGGAVGANEASATNCYVVTLTRTAGVNAVATISSAFGAAAAAVAGATTVTCTGALAAVVGAVGASNTIDIQATITKGGGASDNHTCVATASLLNANSSGVTIS